MLEFMPSFASSTTCQSSNATHSVDNATVRHATNKTCTHTTNKTCTYTTNNMYQWLQSANDHTTNTTSVQLSSTDDASYEYVYTKLRTNIYNTLVISESKDIHTIQRNIKINMPYWLDITRRNVEGTRTHTKHTQRLLFYCTYLNTFGLSAVYDIRELLFMFVRRVNSSSSTTSRTRIISDVHSTLPPTFDDLRAHVSASTCTVAQRNYPP